MKKTAQILFIFFGLLVLANLLFLDWWIVSESKSEKGTSVGETEEKPLLANGCGQSCQETIAEKIQEELEKTPPLAGQSSVTVSPPASCVLPTAGPQAKIVYIPLASSGSTVETGWIDVPGSEFYFDLSNYTGTKEVRFEIYLLALHGSAKVYCRLYDATNKRGVDYSDLSTQNDSFTRLESSGLKIWRGNNKYTVQLRSENGTEVQLKDTKLKILF